MSRALCTRRTFFRSAAGGLLVACGPRAQAPTSAPTSAPAAESPGARAVAVTFDDLIVGGRDPGLSRVQELTDKLLRTLAAESVPTVAFVNGAKFEGEEREARVALLRRWSEAGHELANHTYSHPSLQDTPLAAYEADVVRGEELVRALQAEKGAPLRYFRHPYLRTGPSLEVRAAFEDFLAGRGYTVAPVTLDNADWMYNFIYTEARTRGDAAEMRRIGEAFVASMSAAIDFSERASDALFGRPIAHVLLLHANEINADYFGQVAALLRRRAYRFVTLEEALRDAAYQEPDRYAGPAGVSWLYRWDYTRGARQVDWLREPEPPAFVQEAFEAAQR